MTLLTVVFSCLAVSSGCMQQETSEVENGHTKSIFSNGTLGPKENFTGNAWNLGLVASDNIYNTVIGNVYFEPGARSNWHTHPAGQILIITDGVGFHQVKGQPKEVIRKSDVVKCPLTSSIGTVQVPIPDYNNYMFYPKPKRVLLIGYNQ